MRRLISFVTIAIAFWARPAAAITCDTLPNVVYLQVGDTQTNLMRALGRALRDNTPNPITLVYTFSGSCSNIDEIFNKTAPITAAMQYSPSIAEAASWNVLSDPTLTCTPPGTGVFPDVANSIVFTTTCPQGATTPPTVHLTNGPTQSFVFAVPQASDQVAITFEEAYFVFGFGMAGMISPWTDPTQMFIRTITKGTILSIAAAIQVPAAKWFGVKLANSSVPDAMGHSVTINLQSSPTPENAIGILGAEVYDPLRSTLTALAFRAPKQYAAYYPDSTATSFDKKNVRDGHYYLWGPTVWMDNVVTGTNTPTNDTARYVVDIIANHVVTPVPNFDPVLLVSQVGLVPDCAMKVQRALEGGPLALYTPPTSCTCSFESFVDATSCTRCDDAHPCATGVCRGTATSGSYCEDH